MSKQVSISNEIQYIWKIYNYYDIIYNYLMPNLLELKISMKG